MFHLRKISKSVPVSFRRLLSSQVKPLVGVSVDNEGIATLQLQRAPVNSISLELVQSLDESLSEMEKNKCKGMVLTSVSPTVFSAGLDLFEFYKPDIERFTLFKKSFFDIIKKLYGSNIITTVAINGYTGAGACALAVACDYRAMTTGPATIGLNDTAVGIPAAMWIYHLMSGLMGHKNAEYAITSSFMYSAERALQVGLIDDVAKDKTDAVEKCKAFIRSFDQISPVIRNTTKQSIREQYLSQLEKDRNKYLMDYINLVKSPEFQETVGRYIQSIKKRKNKSINK